MAVSNIKMVYVKDLKQKIKEEIGTCMKKGCDKLSTDDCPKGYCVKHCDEICMGELKQKQGQVKDDD